MADTQSLIVFAWVGMVGQMLCDGHRHQARELSPWLAGRGQTVAGRLDVEALSRFIAQECRQREPSGSMAEAEVRLHIWAHRWPQFGWREAVEHVHMLGGSYALLPGHDGGRRVANDTNENKKRKRTKDEGRPAEDAGEKQHPTGDEESDTVVVLPLLSSAISVDFRRRRSSGGSGRRAKQERQEAKFPSSETARNANQERCRAIERELCIHGNHPRPPCFPLWLPYAHTRNSDGKPTRVHSAARGVWHLPGISSVVHSCTPNALLPLVDHFTMMAALFIRDGALVSSFFLCQIHSQRPSLMAGKQARTPTFHARKLGGSHDRNPYALFCSLQVLELGSGCGLVGLTAALLGANVTMTDLAEVLPSLRHNAERNAPLLLGSPSGGPYGRIRVAELDWTDDDALRRIGGETEWELILASDVMYSDNVFRLFFRALTSIVGVSPAREDGAAPTRRRHARDLRILLGHKQRCEDERAYFDEMRRVFSVELVGRAFATGVYLLRPRRMVPIAS